MLPQSASPKAPSRREPEKVYFVKWKTRPLHKEENKFFLQETGF